MIDREQMLAAYARAWERDEEPGIRAELERCWAPDSTHVSPLSGVVHGVDGLLNLILDFPVMFPDARMRVTGRADIHHDKTFFTWRLTSTTRIRMLGQDYGMSVDGVDFVEFGSEGTIRNITSFFGADRLPEHRNGNDGKPSARTNGVHRNGHTPPERRTPPLGVDVPHVLHLEDGVGEPQRR